MIRPYWPGVAAYALLLALLLVTALVFHAGTLNTITLAVIGLVLVRIAIDPTTPQGPRP